MHVEETSQFEIAIETIYKSSKLYIIIHIDNAKLIFRSIIKENYINFVSKFD